MSMISLKLAPYTIQKDKWPKIGNHIIAQYDGTTIVVYQAYKPSIAEQVIVSQGFHSEACVKTGFNLSRMTWIKPNFLWMMYRSGWATKKDQERILAIRIKRSGFNEILGKAVVNDHGTNNSASDLVRLQWDPDHTPLGGKVDSGRRVLQLGLRGSMLEKFSREFIVSVEDITDFVHVAACQIESNNLETPEETVYAIEDEALAEKIRLR